MNQVKSRPVKASLKLPAKLVVAAVIAGAAVWACSDDEEPPVADAGIGGQAGAGGATSSTSSGEGGAIA